MHHKGGCLFAKECKCFQVFRPFFSSVSVQGVLHTHRSLSAQMQGLVEAWEWSSSDTILHALTLHHIHGIVNALYCPALVGAKISFMSKFSADKVWQQILVGTRAR